MASFQLFLKLFVIDSTTISGMIVFQLGILNRSEVEGDVEEYKLIVDKEENIPDAEKSHSVNYVSYLPLFSIIFINALPYTLSTDFVR